MGKDFTLVTLPGVAHNSQNTEDVAFLTNMLRPCSSCSARDPDP